MKNLIRSILILLLLGAWSSAHAVFITTASGDTYDITTDVGTSIDTLDDLPWWGNSFLAAELRDILGLQLGSFAQLNLFLGGPMFAVSENSGEYCEFGTPCTNPVTYNTGLGGLNFDEVQQQLGPITFAVGRLVTTVPEPTTLALMGLGIAGLGIRRKAA